MRKIRPDRDGNFSFSILKSDFFAVIGQREISSYFKKILKSYGYKVRFRGGIVEIVKFLK